MSNAISILLEEAAVRKCPLPPGIAWDYEAYPIDRVTFRDLGGGVRKGTVEGYTPFSGAQGTPYYQCRNGLQVFWNGVAGNDGTGDGSAANPYKTHNAAQTKANTAGGPCAIIGVGGPGVEIGRDLMGDWTVAPTVPTANLARGGKLVVGSFSAWGWAADSTYAWLSRATRTGIASVYDRNRFDRFGNFAMLIQVASLAACSRIPGSWCQDGNDVVVHPVDEVLVTNANHMVLLGLGNGNAFDKTMGAAPQHLFFDGETDADSWDIRGPRLKYQATAYGAERRIFANRRVAMRYTGFQAADSQNGICANNLWGLNWNEDCYIARAGYDSFNWQNELNAKPLSVLNLNCTAVDSGVVAPGAVGSQNHFALHVNVVGIDVAGDYAYARGGTVKNGDTTQTFMHGSRLRGDRGDANILVATTQPPLEAQCGGNGRMWLSECAIEAGPGGIALKQTENGELKIRNMPDVRGHKIGNIGTW